MNATAVRGLTRAAAVVTGGGSGIGFALARRLHEEGARVAMIDLHPEALDGAVDLLPGSVGFTVDVTDESALRRTVEEIESRFGPIQVYCSNAGIATASGLGDDDGWARAWAVHGMAHVYAARAVVPSMAARGSGHFVITASAAGLLMLMQSAPYTVTKHASVALAEWLAVTYGDAGVGIHCLAPQGVRTPMVGADADVEAEVAASGAIIDPTAVAEAVMMAMETGEFLVLPHPEVRDYERAKVADRTAWLATMRRLRARL